MVGRKLRVVQLKPALLGELPESGSQRADRRQEAAPVPSAAEFREPARPHYPTLEGQDHAVSPEALAPVLTEIFAS